MESIELIADEQKYLVHTYNRPAMVLVHGQGLKVWDLEGKEYYDFIGLRSIVWATAIPR